jgi:AcrR family transcriptional regulator
MRDGTPFKVNAISDEGPLLHDFSELVAEGVADAVAVEVGDVVVAGADDEVDVGASVEVGAVVEVDVDVAAGFAASACAAVAAPSSTAGTIAVAAAADRVRRIFMSRVLAEMALAWLTPVGHRCSADRCAARGLFAGRSTRVRPSRRGSPASAYDRSMSRWEPDARGRLGKAAMELFDEHGYEQTTVAEIAKRAGLTERTFFRHYADKREVLFAGSPILQDTVVDAVTATPEGTAPFDAVVAGLQAAAHEMFRGAHAHARRRHAIVSAHGDLRERELVKLATLSAALACTLRDRGVPEPTASLSAEAGVGVFRVSFERWVDEAGAPRELSDVIGESLTAFRALTSGT